MPSEEPKSRPATTRYHPQPLCNRDTLSSYTSKRPLIDLVTNEWRTRPPHTNPPSTALLNPFPPHDLADLTDDGDDDYTHFPSSRNDAHPLAHLSALARRARARCTRRVRRRLLALLCLLLLAWAAWATHLGPTRAERASLERWRRRMRAHQQVFGANVAVGFDGMRSVATLEGRWVPGAGTGGNRLVIVGDVHGCLGELEGLLGKVGFREGEDHLVLAGDVTSKGPDSGGVVDLARRLGASGVRGNHDDRVLLTYAELKRKGMLSEKASEKAESELPAEIVESAGWTARKVAKGLTKSQVEWLEDCPVILDVGDIVGMGHVVVVHAGLVPGVPLEKQDPYQAMNMRTIDLDSGVPSEERDGKPWEKVWNHHQKHVEPASDRIIVVYGHDAKRGLNVREYSIGLDTGCAKGGALTGLVINPGGRREIVSVECAAPQGYA